MTTANGLVSHTETVLGGSNSPNRLNTLRPTLEALEQATTPGKVKSVLHRFIRDCVIEPISDNNKRRRIALVSAAAGSVLAGLGAKGGWGIVAVEVCAEADHEAIQDIDDTVSGGLVDGAEHPWHRGKEEPSRDKHSDAVPVQSGSYHAVVIQALADALSGDEDALYADRVLGHMCILSAEQLRSDSDIAKVRAAMSAAGLSLDKWDDAITDRRFVNIGEFKPPYDDLTSGGKPNPKSRRNVQQFLTASHSKVWFDEFNKKVFIECNGKSTPLDDESLREWMFRMREAGLPIDKEPASDALSNLALSDRRHPVRDYLKGLKWDGTERVNTWLSKYAGARDTELNTAIGRKFLIGAVRRIMQPGVKLRAMPILEGEQNIGKSLIFKTLAVRPEWYTDSLELGCDPKEVIELTEGKWIVETPELSGMSNRDVEHVKAMISRDVDKARLAYGKFSTEVPRQFVLGGTTNSDEYLKDKTGNTRFWGVRVKQPMIEALEKDRDQLWAEAVVLEARREAHWLDTAELQDLARTAAQRREEKSPLEDKWIELFKQAGNLGNVFLQSEHLYQAAGLDTAKAHQGHKRSLRYAAERTGWVSAKKRTAPDHRPYGYVPSGVKPENACVATYDRINQRFRATNKSRQSGVASEITDQNGSRTRITDHKKPL
jgi:predicted P-loop ATPase